MEKGREEDIKELSFYLLWQKYNKIFLKFISQGIGILFTLNEVIALRRVTITWQAVSAITRNTKLNIRRKSQK